MSVLYCLTYNRPITNENVQMSGPKHTLSPEVYEMLTSEMLNSKESKLISFDAKIEMTGQEKLL